MRKSRTSISKATSYKEIGEFWDTHSLADYWDQTKPAEFEVEIESEITFYPLARRLSEQVQRHAKRQGMNPVALLNQWIEEKLEKT